MKINTPIGELWLAADDVGLTAISFQLIVEKKGTNSKILEVAKEQLQEYFDGIRQIFTLPLSIQKGTVFQKKVWQALQEIPYGQRRTYKEIAEAVASPKAVRAIGQANRLNPLPIVIPCHRVIGQNGQLVGYMGNTENGLLIKQRLLELEVAFSNTSID
ncbi:methylated-DNA--[protein]-cysteine S-methyltransferase [Enterococcus ratti]|uniref:Methylated-DNA--protein-cysteine methyltransferase n=1 Tax=Enterococcus ratti TaxID=150033 RepID=A0A1L8WNW3_9ENTE|nr:methylated-DNA--[protein]-cysteine S-methyltransferase [Enterococcus ratti]OJG82714.1 methylated-DNA-[protein]-cysteine S-methyltransferase [Enterococcus ratti]